MVLSVCVPNDGYEEDYITKLELGKIILEEEQLGAMDSLIGGDVSIERKSMYTTALIVWSQSFYFCRKMDQQSKSLAVVRIS